MAAQANYFVYDTIPYTYSPLRLASSCPFDNFDTLTRSMRDLTTYADHIVRALEADKPQEIGNGQLSNRKHATPQPDAALLSLRPTIHCRETPDGFVLGAATPGLRKDELKVEMLDAAGGTYLEVSGETAVKADASSSKDGKEQEADSANSKDAVKTLGLRAMYRGFSERVRLPPDVDRNAMRATYEDGLLVVTIPRTKADDAKRQRIAIA